MRHAAWIRALALVLMMSFTIIARAQSPDPRSSVTDSAAAAYTAAISRLTSPEFEQRKARRLELQRRGYASVLHQTLARDTWGAVLALLKMEAQLDYHLPSNTLVTTVYLDQPAVLPRGPASLSAPPPTKYMQFPLIEDRRFPRDPWHK
ncbi:MAG: hypothetical protein IPI01_01165 [Ignavibacteriae bacterium]|nr:hypothetical protein [Ignavibacteriota bacterium]